METRLIIAYSLIVALVLLCAAVVAYRFIIRESASTDAGCGEKRSPTRLGRNEIKAVQA